MVINREIVKTGFAKVINNQSNNLDASSALSPSSSLLDMGELLKLQEQAQAQGLGIFSRCDSDTPDGGNPKITIIEAEFEPLEQTTETIWTADGGKQQLRINRNNRDLVPPENPGDVKGCSDFKTYEDALSWFETYEPFFGDVAKLDRDRDGVPCPGLPHTSNRERYRMKIPRGVNAK
jgi:hypothetical protein